MPGSKPEHTAPVDHAPIDEYVIGALILAALLLGFYFTLRGVRRREWPDVGHVVRIVAMTAALTAGVRIGVVSITADELVPFRSEDRLFLPLAGLALAIVSMIDLHAVISRGIESR